MRDNGDFRDLFAAFNSADVRYLLIGGYAVAFHAEPRYTKDLDVWVEPTLANAQRVVAALTAFGAPLGGVTAQDFTRPEVVFQMGVPPNRIDVLTAVSGVSWDDAWSSHVEGTYGDQRIWVIGRDALIRTKHAAGRPQDLLDAELLSKGSSPT